MSFDLPNNCIQPTDALRASLSKSLEPARNNFRLGFNATALAAANAYRCQIMNIMNEPRRKRTGYHPLKSEISYNLLLSPQSGGVFNP